MPQFTLNMFDKMCEEIKNAKPTKYDFVDESYIRMLLPKVLPVFQEQGLNTDVDYVRECIIDVSLALPVPEKEENIILEQGKIIAEQIGEITNANGSR